MRCWNCNRPLPAKAKVCGHCEAEVMAEPTADEMDFARQFLDNLPAETRAELQQALSQSETAEDFADRIFVGDCPKCLSTKTGNCEKDPEIANLLVGRCYECGQLWCTECERLLKVGATECTCFDDAGESDSDEDE